MTCQVVGCREYALAWTLEFEFEHVRIEVALCRRHELDLSGGAIVARPPSRERSA